MSYDKKFMSKFHGEPCTVCKNTEGTHGEHLITKGALGPCSRENVMPICFEHHREKENIGIDGMASKYASYKKWLLNRGWYWYGGKWSNDKVNQYIREIERGWKW